MSFGELECWVAITVIELVCVASITFRVRERVREREGESACMRECVCECVCVCEREKVCVCVRETQKVCVHFSNLYIKENIVENVSVFLPLALFSVISSMDT